MCDRTAAFCFSPFVTPALLCAVSIYAACWAPTRPPRDVTSLGPSLHWLTVLSPYLSFLDAAFTFTSQLRHRLRGSEHRYARTPSPLASAGPLLVSTSARQLLLDSSVSYIGDRRIQSVRVQCQIGVACHVRSILSFLMRIEILIL